MAKCIGLTGGIASGKSTVSNFFKKLNIKVIDADLIARELVDPGKPALKKIEEHFGSSIIKDSNLNRSKLRKIIFKAKDEKKWLNQLLHPLITIEIKKQIKQCKEAYVILDAPLLFEAKLNALTDLDIVIDLDEEIQLERAIIRDNCQQEDVKRIIASQLQREKRIELADIVIDNSRLSLKELEEKVIELDRSFKQIYCNEF